LAAGEARHQSLQRRFQLHGRQHVRNLKIDRETVLMTLASSSSLLLSLLLLLTDLPLQHVQAIAVLAEKVKHRPLGVCRAHNLCKTISRSTRARA
jgi:hypothetical protein